MVFTPTNLFKGIHCPEGEACSLTNCIFKHEPRSAPDQTQDALRPSGLELHDRESPAEPAPKRRKVTYEDAASKPLSKAEQIRGQLAEVRSASIVGAQDGATKASIAQPQVHAQPASLSRRVSPPPTGKRGPPPTGPKSAGLTNCISASISIGTKNTVAPVQAAANGASAKRETLNPRLLPNDPAGHSKRSLYLKHMHLEMSRLNQKVSGTKDLEFKQPLVLNDQELVKLALDEEEQIAREQPTIYSNVAKNKIAAYKKMALQDWVKRIKALFKRDTGQQKSEKPLETGLSEEEEATILPYLVAEQSSLGKFGYIASPPTETEAAEAAAGVETSHNYEVCDRCGSRFQVFPERNEEGLLASHGPCKHHPNKKIFPQRSKTDHYTGHKEPYFPCCNNVVGSPGCTSTEYHAFKSSSPARLAAVLPFIVTPENERPSKDKHGNTVKAVTFDCEMGYTVYGLELIRLTAVAWPSGSELVDVLVRPLGSLIDLNSRFSGVWPEHFTGAIPYSDWLSKQPSEAASTDPLPIVPSPQAARELLCSFLTPTTPLLGHAIDNDLNAVRLCHPAVVDTILLYPHPRGLPMRMGLKTLTLKNLGKHIQMGGDRGHDSLEDARATGELVRKSVADKWSILRNRGWSMGKDGLLPPENGQTTASTPSGEDIAEMVTRALGSANGGLRRDRHANRSKNVDEGGTASARGPGMAAYLQRSGLSASRHDGAKEDEG